MKAVSGLLGGGSGKSSSAQTVTTTSAPPDYLIPYLKDISSKAQAGYNSFMQQGLNAPYSGPRTAGSNPNDTLAMDKALNAANAFDNSGAAGTSYDFGNLLSNKVTSGAYSAPGNMAFNSGSYDLTGAINSAINPVFQQFQEKLVPQLKSAAIESGAYGGSKFNEAEGRLARDTQDTAANIAANIGYQDFQNKRMLDQNDLAQRRNLLLQGNQQELGAAGTVTDLFDKALGQSLQSSDIYSNVADRLRQFEQAQNNDAMSLYADEQAAPWAGLAPYMNLISGVAAPARGSSVKDTTVPQAGSSFLKGLGTLGNIGNAGILQALGTSLPSIGMDLGASAGTVNLLASLAALFPSDIRLKDNIKYEGQEKGHNLYSFNYKLQPHVRYIGVMAQEVLKKVPEAIVRIGDYLAVNYSLLGIEFRRA